MYDFAITFVQADLIELSAAINFLEFDVVALHPFYKRMHHVGITNIRIHQFAI